MTTRSREEQFSGYKLYVNILDKFYNGIALSRQNTFTGKQAVDFLQKILPSIITHKKCTREMAMNLLKLLLNDGYFYSTKKGGVFIDDASASYKFNNEKVEKFVDESGFATAAKSHVRRTSSLRYPTSSASITFTQHILSFRQQSDKSTTDESKHSPRLSMSCNDLTDSLKSDAEKPSTSTQIVQSTKRNIKYLYDSVVRSSDNAKKKNSSLMARGVSPLIHRMASTRNDSSARESDAKTMTPLAGIEETVKPIGVQKKQYSAVTEADEFKLWSYCLMERFKQASGGLAITHDFSGADIRWNCRSVSARGIVAKLPERVEKFEQNREFSTALVDDLRRLANWSINLAANCHADVMNASESSLPTTILFVENNKSTIDNNLTKQSIKSILSPVSSKKGFAVDPKQLFTRIAVMLVKHKFVPLISQSVAHSLIAVFNRMREDFDANHSFDNNGSHNENGIKNSAANDRNFRSMRNLTTSIADVYLRPVNCDAAIPAGDRSMASNRLHSSTELSKYTFSSTRRQTPSALLVEAKSIKDFGDGYAVKTRSHAKKMSLNTSLISAIPLQRRQKFRLCVQLCILSLEPPTRRKLQILIHYLERILRNNELRLHNEKDNRTYILERFSAFFIEPKDDITEMISANFLAFFIDNSQELFFKIPQWLEADVRQKMDNIIAGKEVLSAVGSTVHVGATRRSHDGVYSNRQPVKMRVSNTPPSQMTRAYCDRIDANAFDAQKHEHNDEMLKLLDGIVANENLNPVKKAKMLQQFRLTYPRIYEMRFPAENGKGTEESFKTVKASASRSQSLISRLRRIMIE